MSREKGPFQKEHIFFQPSIFRGKLLVLGGSRFSDFFDVILCFLALGLGFMHNLEKILAKLQLGPWPFLDLVPINHLAGIIKFPIFWWMKLDANVW